MKPTPPSIADDLAAKTDAQLDELFALRFGGWTAETVMRGAVAVRFTSETFQRPGSQPYTPTRVRFKDGTYGGDNWPAYCSDINVVLPYLETVGHRDWGRDAEFSNGARWDGWRVILGPYSATAKTLARAAVEALLQSTAADHS